MAKTAARFMSTVTKTHQYDFQASANTNNKKKNIKKIHNLMIYETE